MQSAVEDNERLMAVVSMAMQKPPDERHECLRRACGGDLGLFHEASEIVKQEEKMGSFLRKPFVSGAKTRERFEILRRRMEEMLLSAKETSAAPVDGLLNVFAGPPTLASGDSFGPYSVRALLGAGGMGEVYLAEDTRLHRPVALKLLGKWFNGESQLVTRFTQEALAASALNHPNVPVVYEAGEIGERHYIASEYVPGHPLSKRMAENIVPWREAIGLILPVASALASAHAAGIIHRDVKPGNILVRDDGAVKLVDFGIAKLAEGVDPPSHADHPVTRAGAIMGTPGYMAPEQSVGLPVDCRADIWSLAAVLHEMLTGRLPLSRGSSRIAASSNMPAPVARVVERALQPDPAKRYSSMAEFAAALIKSQRRARLGAPARLIWIAGAIASVVLLTIGYLALQRRPPRTEPGFEVGQTVKLTKAGNVHDAVISPDSRYVIYSVRESDKESLRLLQVDTGVDMERIPFNTGSYIGLTFSPDGNYVYYTFDPHGNLHALYRATVLPGSVSRKIIDDVDSPATVSPDGHRVAFKRTNLEKEVEEIHVANTDGSEDRILGSNPVSVPFSDFGWAWSPDGKEIILAAYHNGAKAFIVAINAATASRHTLSLPEWDWMGRLSLLRDGQTLIFPAKLPNEPIRLFQFSTNTLKWKAVSSDQQYYTHANSAGSDVVTVQQNRVSSVWVAPARSPSSLKRIGSPAGHYEDVAWSPDGALIANEETGGQENLWRLGLDGAKEQLTQGRFVDLQPTVSAADKKIAFISNRAGNWTIWTTDLDGNMLRQVTQGIEDQSPSFTPDGSILFSRLAAGHAQIWRMGKTGGDPVQLLGVDARTPAVSPSGRYMVCELLNRTSGKWQVAVIELRRLRVVRRFTQIPTSTLIRWSPDESALVYVKEQMDVSGLFQTSIVSGRESSVRKFEEDKIFSFDWSPTTGDLAMVRGIDASDVLLIKRAQ